MVGGLAYLLWPPGAEYLFRQADVLMASEDPSDWRRAQHEYLDDLDKRFPDHKHRGEVDAWRDKADLQQATDRALSMTKALGRPRTEAESQFQRSFEGAEDARKAGRDSVAARLWRDLAVTLEGSKADRGWYLLARIARRGERTADRPPSQGRRGDADPRRSRGAGGPRQGRGQVAPEVVRDFSADPAFDDLVNRARVEP